MAANKKLKKDLVMIDGFPNHNAPRNADNIMKSVKRTAIDIQLLFLYISTLLLE